jgi:hypothetical protein
LGQHIISSSRIDVRNSCNTCRYSIARTNGTSMAKSLSSLLACISRSVLWTPDLVISVSRVSISTVNLYI